VLGRNNGSWAVSLGGRTAWQPWGPLSDDAHFLLIGNVDGIPGDDVLRYTYKEGYKPPGIWEVSSGGRTGWRLFTANDLLVPTAFIGHFDELAGKDLLAVGVDRMSRIFSIGHSNFTPHGLFPY
jgi:hypothetical protein